jgi:hypothetical protein
MDPGSHIGFQISTKNTNPTDFSVSFNYGFEAAMMY